MPITIGMLCLLLPLMKQDDDYLIEYIFQEQERKVKYNTLPVLSLGTFY